jgi:hypothetical protein
MSSRAWTEVATGREGRSLWRWLARAAAPRALRWLVVVAIILTAYVIYENERPWLYTDCADWGNEYLSPSEFPSKYAGNHYAESSWGTYALCLESFR